MTDPFDPDKADKYLREWGHHGFVGVRYIAHGGDWIELAFDPREELMADAGRGVLSSGPIVTLMDMATGFSIWVRAGDRKPVATLDLRVDYLRPARPGRTIHGRGECYRMTRSIAFARGQAHDGDPDDPVANVAATFMFTGERP